MIVYAPGALVESRVRKSRRPFSQMAAPFGPGLLDDGVPTHTSVQQRDAEEACRPLFEELLDEDGVIDREA